MMKPQKVSLKEKIGYGFGDAASSMFWKIFTFYLAIFYTDVFGIPAAATGTMFFGHPHLGHRQRPPYGHHCRPHQHPLGQISPHLLWIAGPFALLGVLLFTTPSSTCRAKSFTPTSPTPL